MTVFSHMEVIIVVPEAYLRQLFILNVGYKVMSVLMQVCLLRKRK